ncbi:hypothetical protein MASR2M15_04880 [Anaerolineales bacterium]
MIICESILLIFGLYFIFTSRVKAFGYDIRGAGVKKAGLVLLAPLAATFVMSFILSYQAIDPVAGTVNMNQISEILYPLSILEIILMIGSIAFAFILLQGAYREQSNPSHKENIAHTETKYSSSPAPAIMSLEEAADYLRVQEDDLIELINGGQIPAARIGGNYRIAKSAIDDYLTNS